MLTEEEFDWRAFCSSELTGSDCYKYCLLCGKKGRRNNGKHCGYLRSKFFLLSCSYYVCCPLFFLQYRHLEVVQNFFRGATPAIVALIAGGVVDIGKSALDNWEDLIIAFLLFFLVVLLELHPLWIVLIGGMLGMVRRKWYTFSFLAFCGWGFFSFGGGMAALPLIEKEVGGHISMVEQRWVSGVSYSFWTHSRAYWH